MSHEKRSVFAKARFIKSCYGVQDFPPDDGSEILFLGRSNAGKSTLINALCHQKSLARVSKTPGRTQCLNVFEFSDKAFLVDAPGYGFAKVRQAMLADWQATVKRYCKKRKSLSQVVLIMDMRHPLQSNDREWIDELLVCGVADRLVLVLSKLDKLTKKEQQKNLHVVLNYLQAITCPQISVFPLSAKSGVGMEALTQSLLASIF